MIRTATPEDARAVGRIQIDAWRAAYQGLLPDETLAALSIDDRETKWREHMTRPRTRLLVAGDPVVGFAHVGPSRDEDFGAKRRSLRSPSAKDKAAAFEIYAIYVDPPEWRRGYGRALVLEAIDHARRSGAPRLTLWVIDGNAPARLFYEKMGFAADGATKNDPIGGRDVVEVRYARML